MENGPKAKIQESAKDLNENNNRKMTSLTASERKRSRTRRTCSPSFTQLQQRADSHSEDVPHQAPLRSGGLRRSGEEAKDQNYVHWLEDPTALGWLRNVFKEHMDVQGAMACLQPWSTPTPEPQLTVGAAPLRLLMRGNVESWNLQAVQDLRLRELSLSRWHEPLNLEDFWLIALFGKDPAKAGEASSSSTPSKLAIKDKIDSDDDEKAAVAVIGQEQEQLLPREMDEENPDGPAEHPGRLKPIFDFRRLFTRLPKLVGKDDITAKRLILGLHERLWHAGRQDIKAIL